MKTKKSAVAQKKYKTIKKIDVVDHFNKNVSPKLWKKNEIQYKAIFRMQLKVLKLYIDEKKLHVDAKTWERIMRSFVYRLTIGYFGIGTPAGLSSGVITKATTVKGAKSTNDHLFGAVAIGKKIHDEFVKSNFDIEYMVEEWLSSNLFLWMTLKITIKEHSKDCVIRDGNTIEEKMNLLHYQSVSELMAKTT